MSNKLEILEPSEILSLGYNPDNPQHRALTDDVVTVLANRYELKVKKDYAALNDEANVLDKKIKVDRKTLYNKIAARVKLNLEARLKTVIDSLKSLVGHEDFYIVVNLGYLENPQDNYCQTFPFRIHWQISRDTIHRVAKKETSIQYTGSMIEQQPSITTSKVNIAGEEMCNLEGDEITDNEKLLGLKNDRVNLQKRVDRLRDKLNNAGSIEKQIRASIAEQRISSSDGGKEILKKLKSADLLKKFDIPELENESKEEE